MMVTIRVAIENMAYILEWFNIPIDTEEAIRERDW